MTENKRTASYGKTINTGNYSSVRIDVFIEFDAEEMTFEEAFARLRSEVAKQIDIERSK